MSKLMSSPPKSKSRVPTPESSKKPCILCIEENEELFRQIKGSLENAGYGVIGTRNSWQALAFLLKSPFHLVLGGELLTRADGVELIQKIRKARPDVPIVLWSRTLPNSMKNLDAFVSAEESPANLLTLLEKLLRRYAAA